MYKIKNMDINKDIIELSFLDILIICLNLVHTLFLVDIFLKVNNFFFYKVLASGLDLLIGLLWKHGSKLFPFITI